jgi:hypothetical protein
MKDLKKIQEFFSNPLEEEKSFTDYSNNELLAYYKNTKDPKAKGELNKRAEKIKALTRTDVNEAGTGVDMAKKQLDALGVKYEMSKTDKVRPFKVIHKPVNKSDEFYDKFEDIVDLFNLKGVVKSEAGYDYSSFKESVNEQADHVSPMVVKAYKEYLQAKKDGDGEKAYRYYSKKLNNTYSTRADRDAIEAILKKKYGSAFDIKESVNEQEEDAVDTITMDIPLFLRMLEYAREDAQKDLDLHDVTEKANKLGKERGILSMEDYEEIVGAAEEIDEAELTEAYVPSNIKDFAKRKGVSSLVNKVAGWAEKVGKRITGGTAIGYNYSTLILDMEYQGSEIRINTDNDTIELYGEPVRSFNDFQRVYIDGQDDNIEENVAPNHDGKAAPYGSGYKPLEEKIAKALDQINEELCPAGKAYIKRRLAAGEKSSAYLSGRAVKVCKGQMSGTSKKKK